MKKKDRRPNIIFINTDQQRADTLGCYGNELIQTPHIDNLSQEGTTFLNAHCTHPLCSPSRVTWITGEYMHSHGLWRNGTALNEDRDTVVKALADNGYHTGSIGKIHLTPFHGDPKKHPEAVQTENKDNPVSEEECWEYWRNFKQNYFGYQYVQLALGHGDYGITGGHYGLWLKENHEDKIPLFMREQSPDSDTSYDTWHSPVPLEIHSATWMTDRAEEYIREHKDEPFFLSIGLQEPHPPFQPPKPYCDMYDPEDMPLPDRREGEWADDAPEHIKHYLTRGDFANVPQKREKEMLALYYGMVSLVDDAVGRILASLKKYNLDENTVVVFTSDHGDWMGDHYLQRKGGVHTSGLTKIPLIIKWPGVSVSGNRVNDISSQIDLAATLYDIAGIKPHATNQGKSLRPILQGEMKSLRDYALIEHRHEPYDESVGVGKYVYGHLDPDERKRATQTELINHLDEDILLKTVVTNDYRLSYIPAFNYGELFDLRKDPQELNNLWGKDAELQQRAMLKLLDALIEATPKCQERKWVV